MINIQFLEKKNYEKIIAQSKSNDNKRKIIFVSINFAHKKNCISKNACI